MIVSWVFVLLWVGVGFFIIVYDRDKKSCDINWLKEIYVNVYIVGWIVVVGVMFLSIMGFLYV